MGGTCRKGILQVLGLCGAESGEDVLQELVGGFVLTLHLVHGGLNGDNAVHVDRSVVDHIRGRHERGLVVRRGVGEGIFRRTRGILSYCKGYCGWADTERDAVLAGDPKVFRLLCNTNLNMNIPSRGSEEERIRILLWVWANIQSDRYNK